MDEYCTLCKHHYNWHKQGEDTLCIKSNCDCSKYDNGNIEVKLNEQPRS